MKILFDQGVPAPLRNTLAGHAISTAYEMGWAELDNGDLLNAAEAAFDAFITTDHFIIHHSAFIIHPFAADHGAEKKLASPPTAW